VILEKDIEQEFCRRVTKRGGLALKFISSVAGVPDRIVVLGGDVFFVELKRPTGKLRKLQKAMIRKLRAAGAEVHVVKTMNHIKDIIP
jgi:hypothetical protein